MGVRVGEGRGMAKKEGIPDASAVTQPMKTGLKAGWHVHD